MNYNTAIESAAATDRKDRLSDFATRVEREASLRGFHAAGRRVIIGYSARSKHKPITATKLVAIASSLRTAAHRPNELIVVRIMLPCLYPAFTTWELGLVCRMTGFTELWSTQTRAFCRIEPTNQTPRQCVLCRCQGPERASKT